MVYYTIALLIFSILYQHDLKFSSIIMTILVIYRYMYMRAYHQGHQGW